MKIRPAFFLVALLLVPGIVMAEEAWQLKKEKNGIQVFVRKVPGSELKEFRGVTYLKGVTLSSLLATLDITEGYTRWLHNCGEARLLKKVSQHERYNYMVTKAPWPVSDRDSVMHSVVSQNPKDLTVTVRMQSVADFMPPVKGRVRIPKLAGLWIYKPLDNGSVMVVYQLHSEPGGKLPASLANTAVVDLPYFTLMNLTKIIQEPQYRDAKYAEVTEPAAKKS